jgi:thioesterase domain-containing protein
MSDLFVDLNRRVINENLPAALKNKILFIVHGADGSIAPFYELAKHLKIQAVAIPFIRSLVDGCSKIEEFADLYLSEIYKIYPDNEYLFVGHSFGGLVAYEMSAQAQTKMVKKIPVFMLDPNLPLAMRTYVAERSVELRVLATTVMSAILVDKYKIYTCEEAELLAILTRCMGMARIEEILNNRRHCLIALSKYIYQKHSAVNAHIVHAAEMLKFDFIGDDINYLTEGVSVPGNHFTMLNAQNATNIAKIINLTLKV